MQYGGFFLDEAGMSVLTNEMMPVQDASIFTSSRVTDHTAVGLSTHVEDHSSMGEG